jgi:hypothetical protein
MRKVRKSYQNGDIPNHGVDACGRVSRVTLTHPRIPRNSLHVQCMKFFHFLPLMLCF